MPKTHKVVAENGAVVSLHCSEALALRAIRLFVTQEKMAGFKPVAYRVEPLVAK